MIHIGEIKHPKIGIYRIEESNDKLFIKKIKEINKEIGREEGLMKLWKIRVLGSSRISADVQKLIAESGGEITPAQKEDSAAFTPEQQERIERRAAEIEKQLVDPEGDPVKPAKPVRRVVPDA